jgi:hypothetical protein
VGRATSRDRIADLGSDLAAQVRRLESPRRNPEMERHRNGDRTKAHGIATEVREQVAVAITGTGNPSRAVATAQVAVPTPGRRLVGTVRTTTEAR